MRPMWPAFLAHGGGGGGGENGEYVRPSDALWQDIK